MKDTQEQLRDHALETVVTPSKEKDEDLELRRRYGREIFNLGKAKAKHTANAPLKLKLSLADRDLLARNIGRHLQRRGLQRRALANTEACRKAGIDHQELYRLVIDPESADVRADRLRADLRKYLTLISSIAELTKMDPELLAHKLATGTSLHPTSRLHDDGMERIIHLLYEVADIIDAQYGLSSRFSILAARKRLLSQDDPYACWPNGTCYRPEPGSMDPFQFSYWRLQDDEQNLDPELMVENTSLLQFLRYVPHILIGIRKNFDSEWRIAEKDSLPVGSRPGIFLGPVLGLHPQVNALKLENRKRLVELVGSSYAPRLSWDRTTSTLMINEIPEDEYIEKSKTHMMAYLREVNINPDWKHDQNELFFEHTLWLSLYPSWHTSSDSEPSMIPVFVQNYAWGGANGELTIEDAEAYLSTRHLRDKFLDDKTLLQRLEEILWISQRGEKPELVSELSRTAEFVEEHPLLKRYRKLEEGEHFIRELSESINRDF